MSEDFTPQALKPADADQVQEWMNNDLFLLQNGAGVTNGQIDPTPEQKDMMHTEMEAALAAKRLLAAEESSELAVNQVIEVANTSASRENHPFSGEKLQEIVDRVPYSVALRLGAGKTTLNHRYNAKDSNFDDVAAGHIKVFRAIGGQGLATLGRTGYENEKIYAAKGVSESVTLLPATEFLDDGENFSVIEYQTQVENQQGKFKFEPGGDKRSGQYVRYRMILPDTEADDLFKAMQADPQIARVLTDKMVISSDVSQDEFGNRFGAAVSEEAWHARFRPPYDDWRTANGGVSRMAFLDGPDVTPEQAKIVEF